MPSLDPNHLDALLTENELAHRHKCSKKKLQADRYLGRGVKFCRIGRLVRYRMLDVLEYELANVVQSTSEA